MDTRSPAFSGSQRSLPVWLLAVFSSASIPVAALATPLSVYLPNYYASHLGLPLAAVGGVFALVRLIDIAFDPMIGVAISATQTRLGRFRPWMVFGAPILVFAVYAIYMAQPGVTTGYLLAWLLVLYIGFSVLTLGHASWAAALVPEYHGRSHIYGWMQATGVAGLGVALRLPSFSPSPAAGNHPMCH